MTPVACFLVIVIPGAEPRIYDVVSDYDQLSSVMIEYLGDYNGKQITYELSSVLRCDRTCVSY